MEESFAFHRLKMLSGSTVTAVALRFPNTNFVVTVNCKIHALETLAPISSVMNYLTIYIYIGEQLSMQFSSSCKYSAMSALINTRVLEIVVISSGNSEFVFIRLILASVFQNSF